ncbi:MAG: FHA domain-containing protein [Lachnospiraceae bacterium]
MTKIKKKKILLDTAIVVLCCGWTVAVWMLELSGQIIQVSVLLTLLVVGVVLIDVLKLLSEPDTKLAFEETAATASFMTYELILLNETDKPIRSWNLTGKTAMIIGRRNRNEEVDVDLSDCEYSALISVQHAVLNYSLESWYVEDLGSQNGIQIKKVEDGGLYQVAPNHPCKISAGDMIYIAKTKLLLT